MLELPLETEEEPKQIRVFWSPNNQICYIGEGAWGTEKVINEEGKMVFLPIYLGKGKDISGIMAGDIVIPDNMIDRRKRVLELAIITPIIKPAVTVIRRRRIKRK